MDAVRFFHETSGDIRELPSNPFPYERGLQEFFEKHLRALTGIDILASEYSTGQRHSRRIDTLGIDAAGRPVVRVPESDDRIRQATQRQTSTAAPVTFRRGTAP